MADGRQHRVQRDRAPRSTRSSFTLLIPFLNALFNAANVVRRASRLARATCRNAIGRDVPRSERPARLAEHMMWRSSRSSSVKNVFVWLAGQLGASLQEYVTRDLRDAVFRHMQRLPLRYFQRTKAGQIISKILSDTDQTKALDHRVGDDDGPEPGADRRRRSACCSALSSEAHAAVARHRAAAHARRSSRCCARCDAAIVDCATTTARSRACCRKW